MYILARILSYTGARGGRDQCVGLAWRRQTSAGPQTPRDGVCLRRAVLHGTQGSHELKWLYIH